MERINLIAIILLIAEGIYMMANFFFQHRGEKKLEQLLLKHKAELFDKMQTPESLKTDITIRFKIAGKEIDTQFLVIFLKEEINKLAGFERWVLKKTFERKNAYSQARYAFRLFSGIGLKEFAGRNRKIAAFLQGNNVL